MNKLNSTSKQGGKDEQSVLKRKRVTFNESEIKESDRHSETEIEKEVQAFMQELEEMDSTSTASDVKDSANVEDSANLEDSVNVEETFASHLTILEELKHRRHEIKEIKHENQIKEFSQSRSSSNYSDSEADDDFENDWRSKRI